MHITTITHQLSAVLDYLLEVIKMKYNGSVQNWTVFFMQNRRKL